MEGLPQTITGTFNHESYHALCERLAGADFDLKTILSNHGYPPMWTRDNSFETLVHIILEQQVSLASAQAALNKLREKCETIHPDAILQLSDEEMRACFVSRQKAGYIRGLAEAINNGAIRLSEFKNLSNDEVRQKLIRLKGIGHWTIDVYLMFVLQRTDIFPLGDLAAVNALKRLKKLDFSVSKEEVAAVSERWKPFRTIATMMLWHYYLSNPRKV